MDMEASTAISAFHFEALGSNPKHNINTFSIF